MNHGSRRTVWEPSEVRVRYCIIEGRILGENPNKPTIRIAHSQGPICFFISLPDTGTCSIYPETTFFDWYRLPGGLNELVLLGILAGAPEWAIPTGIFYFLFFIFYIDALVRRKGHHEYLIWGGIEGRKKEKVLSFIFFGC